MADTPAMFPSGTRFGEGGRYEIRRRVGKGGMAEVYKAVDRRLGRRVVAIKTLSASMADHPFAGKMRELFIQEAQALSLISDDHVVSVFDFGVENGTPYMVMEYLRGVDLGAFLRAAKHFSVEEAVDLMLAICSGVYACHQAGIVHRDLKPGNIFLSQTPQGRQPKVLDFGVAKVPAAADDAESDRTELVVGTPSYMSPEQAAGRPANAASDQYAIGALLCRCIYGRVPEVPASSLPDVKGRRFVGLVDVIRRALDPTPAKRFGSVHELGQALLAFSSPVARARWKTYYHVAPRRFDPNTTGSITFATNVAEPLSDVATVVVERAPSSIGPADPTVLDAPPSRSEIGSMAATTIDVGSSAVVADLPEMPADVSYPGARPPQPRRHRHLNLNHDRLKIIGGAALAAALIATVSVGAARHVGRTIFRPAVLPSLAGFTSDPRPAEPSIPAAISVIQPPLSPPPSATAAAPTENNLGVKAAGVPSTGAVESSHHARRHREHTAPAPVPYGEDGLPILH